MIPPSVATGLLVVEQDPVAMRYRQYFSVIDWSVAVTSERDPSRPGPKPDPLAAFLKALLVKIVEGKPSIPTLRSFLLEHPALVMELGFRPVPDASQALGFDVERTVPSERWLRHHQQHDAAAVKSLFAASVHAVQQRDPSLGEVVAIDVTHHYAWVRENNPNQTLSPRFHRDHQPAGDPDCRLGGKTRHPTPNRSQTEAFWGYLSGIFGAPSTLGEVVVAAEVRPVDIQDVRFFAPLAAQTEAVLGRRPVNLTADAAFDAWRVYDWVARDGGMAAIPLNPRGGPPPRTPEGYPCCAMGLVMTPGTFGRRNNDYAIRNFTCPLRGVADAHCSHPRFARGGCIKRMNIEPGGQQRLSLDRSSPAYVHLYHQRTIVERLFSRLKHRGLERLCARRLSTVTTILLLGYLAINLLQLAAATHSQTPNGGLAS